MEMIQLFNLASVTLNHYGSTYDVSLNWIGKIIEWLVAGIGIVGVGVIVFSLILKFIVLPFDVFQRISMRKQNNKMQENQEKMERLQKQYANDKEKYNQKVMEMYKENGISMFSSCLPMILSMVVFFAAIGGFNAYSSYANIQNYNEFVKAYNDKIESYAPAATESTVVYVPRQEKEDENGEKTVIDGYFEINSAENTVYYTIAANGVETVEVDGEKVVREKDFASMTKEQQVAYVQSVLLNQERNANGEVISPIYKAKIDQSVSAYGIASVEGEAIKDTVLKYYSEQAQEAVRSDYEANSYNRVGFLWVKNVWNVDASYESPLTEYGKMMTPSKKKSRFDMNGQQKTYDEMKAYAGSPYSEAAYNEITDNLTEAKGAPNGYFILIVLSIGTILLQQFISMRSQKAQNKYSSVDGQQATTQKTTMIVMTIMFGIFSFMYSAAFSIYMVVSSIFSLGSTVVINKIVDTTMKKKEDAALRAKYTRTLPGQKNVNTNSKKKK